MSFIFGGKSSAGRSSARSSAVSRQSQKQLIPYVRPPSASTHSSRPYGSQASSRRSQSAFDQPSDGGMTVAERQGFFFKENAPQDYFHDDDTKDEWDRVHKPRDEVEKVVRRDPDRAPYQPTVDQIEEGVVMTVVGSQAWTERPRSSHPPRQSHYPRRRRTEIDFEAGDGDDLTEVGPTESISQVSSNPSGMSRQPPQRRFPQRAPSTTSQGSQGTRYSVTSTQMEAIVAKAIRDHEEGTRGNRER